MYCSGDQFLSGTALAMDDNRRFGLRHIIDKFEQFLHDGCIPKDTLIAVIEVKRFSQGQDFLLLSDLFCNVGKGFDRTDNRSIFVA